MQWFYGCKFSTLESITFIILDINMWIENWNKYGFTPNSKSSFCVILDKNQVGPGI